MRRKYSREERLKRASLRVAMLIRGMWEEKGSSDTRLLEAPLLADELTIAGESLGSGSRWRREHVVPRLVVIKKCHEMLVQGCSDEALAKIIRENVKIVRITHEESVILDRQDCLGLKQSMPAGWEFGHDPFARLAAARIVWKPRAEP